MEVEKGVGPEVLSAVVERAVKLAREYKTHIVEARRCQEALINQRDACDIARGKYEQCVDYLDEVEPDWRLTVGQTDQKVLDLDSPEMVARPS